MSLRTWCNRWAGRRLAQWCPDSPPSALHAEWVKQAAANQKAAAASKTKRAAYEKTLVDAAVFKPFETDEATKKTVFAQEQQTAAAAIKGFGADDLAASMAYRDAVDALGKLLGDYLKDSTPSSGKSLDSLDKALVAASSKRADEHKALEKAAPKNPALASLASLERVQDEWMHTARMLTHTRGRTKRLQKFVDLVNTEKLKPITKYAQDNWPYKPEEFYAETYALWITEPNFLNTLHPKLFDFFSTGAYTQ